VSSPICGSWPDIYYFLTVTVLFLWDALSEERTGLSFVYAAGPRQHSLSLVQIPWDSWPSCTVSDLRLPFPSPPTTRRVTVEVSDPASTRMTIWNITSVALYRLRTDQEQKTRFYCCARIIAPWTSHVTPIRYCWSVTSCACVKVCLPSRNLETDFVTPLFHCWYVSYLETADSVAQTFLHGVNTPQYFRKWKYVCSIPETTFKLPRRLITRQGNADL
jgi:hypothetical protein